MAAAARKADLRKGGKPVCRVSPGQDTMAIAIIHDWLTGMRGGEKVLAAMASLYPQADLFTLIHLPGSVSPQIERHRITASWMNRLPRIGRYYRYLLPLMPRAAESLDLRAYDLVLSSSHCVAKGVRKAPGAIHICYCHSPMRYAWSLEAAYRQTMGLGGLGLRLFRRYLRSWDRRTADGVDHFLANSHNVAGRIRDIYGREATVVYPPVDTEYYTPSSQPREDFYLVVGALAPYKRVDQAVEAFRRMPQRRLLIIGSGQMAALRESAPVNVTFLGWQSDEVIRDHYRRAKALLFPGEEDFGIVPVEAMACGCPVIAYGAGGALETVLDATADERCATGVHYRTQTVEAIVEALRTFEARPASFVPERIVRHARQFSGARFCEQYARQVGQLAGPAAGPWVAEVSAAAGLER